MKDLTYEELVQEICARRRFGSMSGREATARLFLALGNPEKDLNIIHIAGTNGKGSTAAFIDSILRAASFKVGLFTSPHLVEFSERIQVNGEKIDRASLMRLGRGILEMDTESILTMFDIALGIAILYFIEQDVDYVVLETGLGGRLDSTAGLSVVPLVSVITGIGLEHTSILGDTVEKIAYEKAGIIKSGTICLMSSLIPDSAKEVIWTEAIKKGALCQIIGSCDSDIELGLLGAYQRSNAGLAIACANMLGVDGRLILEGLGSARWPGRMEKVMLGSHELILDGAHNPQGVEALCKSLAELYAKKRLSFLMGVMADKDYDAMVLILKESGLVGSMHAVSVSYSRTLSADELAGTFGKAGLTANAYETLECGLEAALEDCESDLPVVVCGSLYFIGEVKEYLSGK